MPDPTAAPATGSVASNISTAIAAKTAPVADAKATGNVASTTAADPNAGKEKYTVDGQDRWLSPAEARAYVQKGIAFEPKASQLTRLEQETRTFLKTLSDDPGKVIFNEKLGKPADVLRKVLGSAKVSDDVKEAIGEWYYRNVVVPSEMSPEQRQQEEYKRQAEEFAEYKRQQEETRLSTENEQKVQHALNTIKAQIGEAMQEAGVPMDSKIAPQLAKRVAQIMQLGFVNGKVVTPKEAIAKAKNELVEYKRSYMDGLDGSALIEYVGKDVAEKIRKHFVEQAKGGSDAGTPKQRSDKPAKRDERKVMTPDEFRDYLSDLKKQK